MHAVTFPFLSICRSDCRCCYWNCFNNCQQWRYIISTQSCLLHYVSTASKNTIFDLSLLTVELVFYIFHLFHGLIHTLLQICRMRCLAASESDSYTCNAMAIIQPASWSIQFHIVHRRKCIRMRLKLSFSSMTCLALLPWEKFASWVHWMNHYALNQKI